jgi:putative transposase
VALSTDSLDAIFDSEAIRILRTTRANAACERGRRTMGRQHPETVLSGYVVLDNQHRPQRLLGQAPPLGVVPPPAPAADVPVVRLDRLSGLIHEYAEIA